MQSLYKVLQSKLGNRDSKKVANHTYLCRYWARVEDYIALKLHQTEIVKVYKNGKIQLSSGGWRTNTTKQRFNAFFSDYGLGYAIWQDNSIWYLATDNKKYYFEDNMNIGARGSIQGNEYSDKKEKQVKELKKQIRGYIQGFMQEMSDGRLEYHQGADCWHCGMVDKQGKTLGELSGSNEHILEHLKESYYVPSLLFNAVKAYPVGDWTKNAISQYFNGDIHYFDKKDSFSHVVVAQVSSSLRRYLYKNLGLSS
jgi:hypothetical protein